MKNNVAEAASVLFFLAPRSPSPRSIVAAPLPQHQSRSWSEVIATQIPNIPLPINPASVPTSLLPRIPLLLPRGAAAAAAAAAR
jgi:hypothetical protein